MNYTLNKRVMLLAATLWAACLLADWQHLNAQTGMNMKHDMSLITIEEHFADPGLAEADAKWRPKKELTDEQREVMAFFASRMNLTEQLGDLAGQRIPHMDEQHIGLQILSYTSLIGDYVPADEAVKIARQANDLLAARIKEHPDRFRAMATLPLADPVAAAKELDRCVKELGFVGVLLYGQYKGHWLEEAQFLPIFEKAAELDIPVYLHPALINPVTQQSLYMSPAYSAVTGAELSSAAIGWHYDVGIQAVRLILAGLFDRFPMLKVVSGHWGEGIPMFLDRMNHQLTLEMTGLQHDFAYYYKRNIYLTPSGIMSDINLRTMVELMGADHILYAEDYPYEKPSNFYDFLMQSSLTDEQKELIAHKNVERLYKLPKLSSHPSLLSSNMVSTKDIELKNSESGKMLRGTLYLPANVAGNAKHPLIITAHELGSDSQRPWWVNYARHWAAEGYAVLTFDFAGGGQRSRSEGKTTDMSVLTEVSDLEQMLSLARTWDFVDTSRIALVGGSQGGGVATIVAARHAKDISAQVLLYPAFHLPDNLHKLYPDLNNLPETDGRNGMITIGKKYILDMYDYDYDKDMKAYGGPVLIVHGDVDKTVPIGGSQRAVNVFPNARLHTIKGAGHVFLTEPQQAEFLKQADEFLRKNLRIKN